MAFWSNWFKSGDTEGDSPQAENPGDPDGVEFRGKVGFSRSLPGILPNPWDGWPANWGTSWQSPQTGLSRLIDTAWACIDLNASVLATMPFYRLKGDAVVGSKPWMVNPDPLIYQSRIEFLKQLFWAYQTGEAFVLSMGDGADGYPARMRVIPPWLVQADLKNGTRVYKLGSQDMTEHILHIRYFSSIDNARGFGPLDAAGARMTTAGLLQKYAQRLAETGGTPQYWLGVPQYLNPTEAQDLLDGWIETRERNAGYPAVASNGATLNKLQSMSAKDMALLELAQFTESRVAILLGVPPFLVGLPSGGDSMTYSNVSQIFDFHDRSSLRPKATDVMSALSLWALPGDECVELNRDEYSRPDFAARLTAYKNLMDVAVATGNPEDIAEVWTMIKMWERFHGPQAGRALSGNNNNGAALQSEVGNAGRIGTGYGH